jgi:hypothetical protein
LNFELRRRLAFSSSSFVVEYLEARIAALYSSVGFIVDGRA